jgi:hypothetical protein
MCELEDCRHSTLGCDFSDADEIDLTRQIMTTVVRFRQDGNASPCPSCLRDTLLAVAALLHIEEAKLARDELGPSPMSGIDRENDFIRAAREKLKAADDASAALKARRGN